MKNLVVLFFLVLVSGCSFNQEIPSTSIASAGVYKVVATAQTQLDKDGGLCADATGIFEIHNNVLSGTAVDSFNRKYSISGEVEPTGKIVGGFATTAATVVKYQGMIQKENVQGTWEDIFECKGVWKATQSI